VLNLSADIYNLFFARNPFKLLLPGSAARNGISRASISEPRGYAVSTVGFELEQVRQYIREQQGADATNGQF
jgi:hypothetical protein